MARSFGSNRTAERGMTYLKHTHVTEAGGFMEKIIQDVDLKVEGPYGVKNVLLFTDGTKLNTNGFIEDALAKSLSDDIDEWTGTKLKLSVKPGDAARDISDCIIVEVASEQGAHADEVPADPMGDIPF